MRQTQRIQHSNELELGKDLWERGSWHDQFKDSPNIYVGNLSKELNEGDIQTIFSQYGIVTSVNLSRNPESGLPRGFAFLSYEDPQSARLAVDNFNGIVVAGQKIRVDHAAEKRDRPRGKSHPSRITSVSDEMLDAFINESRVAVEPAEPEQTGGSAETEQKPSHKRPRTEEERTLRELFKRGEITQEEYTERKIELKKKIYQRRLEGE